MENITIQLSTPMALSVAIGKGWQATIEDTTQELVGDVYSTIPNPVTYQQFLQALIPEFISDYVLTEGRNRINNDFNSIAESVKYSVTSGTFDDMILQGDLQGIKDLVFESISS